MELQLFGQKYRISSFKLRGVYKIPKVLDAALFGGGVYIFVNVSLYIRKV